MIKIKVLLLALGFVICSLVKAEQAHPEKYEYSLKGWNKWKAEYDQTVVGKGGWLSLAGLYWLTEGANTIGSAKDNHHQFPSKAPKHLGTILVVEDKVSIDNKTELMQVEDSVFKRAELSAKDKTLVTFGDFEFFVLKREIGFAVRLIDNDSENIKSFEGTKFITYDQSWVKPAKLIKHEKPQIIKIPTVYGTVREDTSAGWLEFEIGGKIQRLQAVDYGKDSLMYVMFSDSSSGDNTYGAGRYIEVEWPDENGNTFIDFNRAYNPACAFTNYATCPLTPRQNRLKVTINAGELDVAHKPL